MADVKTLKTRIALKYDSYANWTTAPGKDLVLLKGEIGICYIGDTNPESKVVPTVLFKVGDGTKTFETLPWASAKAADVYNWAKSETVTLVERNQKQYLVFKTGEVENHSVDLSSFATDADVAGLDSRITALEGHFGDGDSTIDSKIEALEGRMADAEDDIDTLESAKLDASVFNTFNDGTSKKVSEIEADIVTKANAARDTAKTYADGLVAAEESAREAADLELGGRLDTAEGKLNTLTGVDTVDGSVAKALKDAKDYADTKKSEVIGTSGDASTVNTVYGAKKYAEEKAAAAQAAASEALTTAVGTLNTKDAELVAEDTRLAGLISAEVADRQGADNALDGRLQKVEAFFEGAAEDSEGLNDALDKLVDIQNYLNGEGSGADGLMGQVSANATAIENLEGRVDTAEDDIDALEGRATALEGTVGDASKGLVKAVADLETKTAGFTGTISARVEEVAGVASAAQDAADAAQGDVDALEGVVSTLRSEYDVTKALATTNESAIDALEGRTDVLEGTVGDANTGLVKDVADLKTASAKHAEKTYVDGNFVKTSDYATDKAATQEALGNVYTKTDADGKFGLKTDVEQNASDITAVSGRVQTIENDYLKAADFFIIDCGNATLREGEPTAQ